MQALAGAGSRLRTPSGPFRNPDLGRGGAGGTDLNMDLIQMDVTDHASVATTVQHVIAKAGRIGRLAEG